MPSHHLENVRSAGRSPMDRREVSTAREVPTAVTDWQGFVVGVHELLKESYCLHVQAATDTVITELRDVD